LGLRRRLRGRVTTFFVVEEIVELALDLHIHVHGHVDRFHLDRIDVDMVRDAARRAPEECATRDSGTDLHPGSHPFVGGLLCTWWSCSCARCRARESPSFTSNARSRTASKPCRRTSRSRSCGTLRPRPRTWVCRSTSLPEGTRSNVSCS